VPVLLILAAPSAKIANSAACHNLVLERMVTMGPDYDPDVAARREQWLEMDLDPADPDFTDLAPEGMTGDETDDEDLRDAADDIEDPDAG
jgi:hypothetical protein